MPREADPINDPELFDTIDLGGVFSPGTVKLSGHEDKVGWDVKAGSGQKGASMTRKGVPPPEFTATFYLANEEQIGLWVAFRDAINATVQGTPKGVDIYHPDLVTVGITSVVKASIGGAVDDGKGGRTIVVKFQVYAPPVAVGGSPSGSTSKKPDPNAAANAELAALTAQYAETPWG